MQSYNLGVVTNRNGGGSGSTLLTTGYQPGGTSGGISTRGLGYFSVKLNLVKGGATSLDVRVMDYTDPANPRVLQSRDEATDGGATTGVHNYTADAVTELTGDLRGTVEALAVEVRGNGGINASSSVIATLYASELPR